MSSIFEKIQKLENIVSLSKQEKIIQGVIDAIKDEIVVVGSKLPSVIQLAKAIGCANKTVADSYEVLKKRGLIEAKSTKGYYLISTETNTRLKIAVVLYAFQSFQKDFYSILRNQLGDDYQIDIFFHHNNISVFQNIMNNTRGKYGFYIIAPIQIENFVDYISFISVDRLLLVDRWVDVPKQYSYIIQEFEYTMYLKLSSLISKVKTYKKIVLFFNKEEDHPIGLRIAFKKFVTDFNLDYEICDFYEKNSLKKSTLYFFPGDTFFWELLRDVKQKSLNMGDDIGIISLNDSIAKELIFGGITTITTDYELMAKKSAGYVKYKKSDVQEIIPSKIIRRRSF